MFPKHIDSFGVFFHSCPGFLWKPCPDIVNMALLKPRPPMFLCAASAASSRRLCPRLYHQRRHFNRWRLNADWLRRLTTRQVLIPQRRRLKAAFVRLTGAAAREAAHVFSGSGN